MKGKRFLHLIFALFGLFYAIFILMGLFNYIPPNFYKVHQNNFQQLQPPSSKHLLGTDWFKQDVFSEFVYGAKSTFYSGLLAALPFLIFGILLGVGSAYKSGRTSYTVDKALEILNSFPKLIVLLLFIGLFGNHIKMIMVLFGIISSPKLAELIKGKIISLKKEAFIDSSIALGISHSRIIFKHILWHNCREIIVGQLFYIYAAAVLVEASLSYVQLGFSQNAASWGWMLAEARTEPKVLFTWPWSPDFHLKAVIVILALTGLSLGMFYLSQLFRDKDLERRGLL